MGARLAEGLEAVRGTPGVADVRTKGALGVIELTRMRDSDWLKARFIEEGIWLRPFGNIIYTTPPLTTDMDDVARIADVMGRGKREGAERACSRPLRFVQQTPLAGVGSKARAPYR